MNKSSLISRNGPAAKVLCVEGNDDFHFIANLREQHNLSETAFTIEAQEGIENILAALPIRLKAKNETELGIIVDADTDTEARWASLRNILLNAGYTTVPEAPEPTGTILREIDRTAVGVWIMPDNAVPGILENFVRYLVPTGDKLWLRAEQCVTQIPAEERLFSEVALPKALLHTWLAWQEEPGRPIGQAIKNKSLDANALQAQSLIAWLRKLFIV